MSFDSPQRITRRRSSAGPIPPRRPLDGGIDRDNMGRQGPRPTFLTLRDHGKVYVADLPNLSDGQIAHIGKEAQEVLSSLERRLEELEEDMGTDQADNDTFIKASTKREVTLRFLNAITAEQEHRRNNPALKDAAAQSLPRTFLEVARHRLPGSTFDSLLREALEVCSKEEEKVETPEPDPTPPPPPPVKVIPLKSPPAPANSMPVVLSPDPKK